MPHKGRRHPVHNRSVFLCLLFVLKTEIGRRDLPAKLGASEKTVRRPMMEWSESGLWTRIFEHPLERASASGRLELAELLIDAGLVKAPSGGKKLGRTRLIGVVAAVN